MSTVDHLRRWREGRADRFHVPSGVAEGGLPSRSLPGPTALAQEYLSEVFADRYRRRARDNGLVTLDGAQADESNLRREIVAHLAGLPEDDEATRPYRDAREIVAERDDPDSWRGRRREQWVADVTRSTRANLPRFAPVRAPRPQRAVPVTPADERRATRRRVRYDELEAVRRALHAYFEGFPHDAQKAAARRASVPFRTKIGDLVAWILGVIGIWEARWQEDVDGWPDEARRIGAPRRPIAFPGPRITGHEVRRAHSRVRRVKGFDYVSRSDYLREEMRTIVRMYDLIDELEQSLHIEHDADRAGMTQEFIDDLRALMLGESVALVAAAEGAADRVAA